MDYYLKYMKSPQYKKIRNIEYKEIFIIFLIYCTMFTLMIFFVLYGQDMSTLNWIQ